MEEDQIEPAAEENAADSAITSNAEAPQMISTPTQAQDAATSMPAESVYSIAELSGATTALGTRPECIMAALRESEKTEFTLPEAKQIVNKFLKREVKR